MYFGLDKPLMLAKSVNLCYKSITKPVTKGSFIMRRVFVITMILGGLISGYYQYLDNFKVKSTNQLQNLESLYSQALENPDQTEQLEQTAAQLSGEVFYQNR